MHNSKQSMEPLIEGEFIYIIKPHNPRASYLPNTIVRYS